MLKVTEGNIQYIERESLTDNSLNDTFVSQGLCNIWGDLVIGAGRGDEKGGGFV